MAATPANSPLQGDWVTPDHAAVQIYPCGEAFCLRIARLPPRAPATVDGLNPNQNLRSRPLCGLEIGHGFRSAGAGRAEGGSLYDPKTGKTYHGVITATGDTLHLRGYVGIRLFGRSETWTRSRQPIASCAKNG